MSTSTIKRELPQVFSSTARAIPGNGGSFTITDVGTFFAMGIRNSSDEGNNACMYCGSYLEYMRVKTLVSATWLSISANGRSLTFTNNATMYATISVFYTSLVG